MNRKTLEALATYLAVVVLGVLVVLCIVGIADGIFAWDLLPPMLDKIAVLTFSSLGIVLAASVVVSIMLNLSLIAERLAALLERLQERVDE